LAFRTYPLTSPVTQKPGWGAFKIMFNQINLL
jgi:hypothetical protein